MSPNSDHQLPPKNKYGEPIAPSAPPSHPQPPVQSPTEHQPVNQPAHPQQPQVVYLARPLTPHEPHISDDVKRRHEEAKTKYPELNLSDGEYIISAITRHPIGLIEIWSVVGLIVLMTLAFVPFYAANRALFAPFFLSDASSMPSAAIVMLPLLALSALFAIGGYIATTVYLGNKFFLTNESVIQIIRTSIFSTKEQTISLANIEDASFRQHGILQTILNYGSLRLSTEGDETTYRFNYVANPRKQVADLNNAVEAFKNGRPVD